MSTTPPALQTTPHALPGWVYTDPRMAALEQERLLKPSWQIVCHQSQLPDARDYQVLDVGTDSVIVVKDAAGVINAYHNHCRHRGARLLSGNGRCSSLIVCPYHGFAYNLQGELVGVPQKDTFDATFNRQEWSLKRAPVALWNGFVFVWLSEQAPRSLAEQFAPFEAELAPYQLAQMVPLAPIEEEIWPVNWKVAMDNYLESYHVPIGHPGLYRLCHPDYENQRAVNTVARGISRFRAEPSTVWTERLYLKLVQKLITHLPAEQAASWRFYSALPNLGMDFYPEQMDFFQILPTHDGKTRLRYARYGLPDARPEVATLRRLGLRLNRSVNAEDKTLCLLVQRGIESSAYTPGPLSTLERWMGTFHAQLEAAIPEIRRPHPPAEWGKALPA